MSRLLTVWPRLLRLQRSSKRRLKRSSSVDFRRGVVSENRVPDTLADRVDFAQLIKGLPRSERRRSPLQPGGGCRRGGGRSSRQSRPRKNLHVDYRAPEPYDQNADAPLDEADK